VEFIPKVVLPQWRVGPPLRYLFKNTIGTLNAKGTVTLTTDKVTTDCPANRFAPPVPSTDKAAPLCAVESVFVVVWWCVVMMATAAGEVQRLNPLCERLAVPGFDTVRLLLIGMDEFVADRLFQCRKARSLVGRFRETNRTLAAAVV
jgi:hypothetical protein